VASCSVHKNTIPAHKNQHTDHNNVQQQYMG